MSAFTRQWHLKKNQRAIKPPNISEHLPIELMMQILGSLTAIRGMRRSLCLVCRRWRDIVHQIHQFWTDIRIVLQPIHLDILQEDPRTLAKLAARAGSLPLQVVWCVWDCGNADLYNEALQYLIEVAPFHRWQSLQLWVVSKLNKNTIHGSFDTLEKLEFNPSWENIYPVIELVASTALQLKVIELSFYHDRINVSKAVRSLVERTPILKCPIFPTRFFAKPPTRLTRLELFGLGRPQSFSTVSHLELKEVHLPTACASTFPNVEVLRVGKVSSNRGFQGSLVLPKLYRLIHSELWSQLFDFIYAPLLQELQFSPEVQTSLHPRTHELPLFLSTVQKLGITRLELDAYIIPKSMGFILESCDNLKHLCLSISEARQRGWGEVQGVFSRIRANEISSSDQGHHTSSEPLYCSCLLTLRLYFDWTVKHTESWTRAASNMLLARRNTALKSITCLWKDGNEVTVLQETPCGNH